MTNTEIISEVKKILGSNTDKYLYRNLGAIANQLGVNKITILRALTTCKDIEIIFNEESYNPNSGPLFALKDCIKQKIKENRILLEKEKENKEKEKENKEKEKDVTYKKPIKSSSIDNRRRMKNCTKKFISIYKNLDEVLKLYSISLSKNDEEIMKKTVCLMSDFTELIRTMIDKNDFTKYELEDNKK